MPLDLIDLDLPLAGVRGVGYVLPQPANPAEGSRHRVYLKGMLLSDSTAGLLPDWAFFVRCVIDTDTLKPTASREALYEDETLVAVSEALGVQIRDWLTELAATEPHRLAAFLDVHALGVKALASHDRELLRMMLPHLRFESSDGPVTLAEFARNHPHVYVAPTVDEFRQVAPIASAQGIGVINGGYTYDGELVAALPGLMPGISVENLDASVVTAALDPVAAAAELALAGCLAMARVTMDPLDCDVILRAFHPVTVSALHLDSRAARTERARAEVAADADDLWAEILGSLKATAPRAQLVLNYQSPIVRRLGPDQGAGTAHRRRRVAVRPGPADDAPAAAALRRGAAQPDVRGAARAGPRRPRRTGGTSGDERRGGPLGPAECARLPRGTPKAQRLESLAAGSGRPATARSRRRCCSRSAGPTSTARSGNAWRCRSAGCSSCSTASRRNSARCPGRSTGS